MENYQVLLLNSDYSPLSLHPLSTISWEQAVKLVYEGVLEVVAEYDKVVRSPSTEMRIPSVVALKNYVQRDRYVAFNKFNVFLRDGFRCQYCQKRFDSKELTFDHVVPRSKGGKTTWDNIVSACTECNARKADNPNVKPIRAPFKPTVGQLMRAQREFPPRYVHESWKYFLYWFAPLDGEETEWFGEKEQDGG
jgi:5-methylcytosine-specific restriction endonuclease McrA